MFQGWYVVGGAFLIAVWSWGLAFYGLGIYLVALGREHGWSISAVSVAITAYYLMGAGATASVGGIMRRIGAHRAVAGGVIAMAIGVASLGSIDALWQLYLALAAMALGWSAMSGAAINILVAPWFERKRGVAVSLALTGASGGGVIVAPALLVLIAHVGFAPALRIAAMAMVATLLPVAALVLRRTPTQLGLRPDGDPRPAEEPLATSAEPPTPPLSASLRSRAYWTISIAFATGLAAQVGVLTHLVSHLTPLLGAAGAGGALSLTTLAAIAGRVPMGALADRLDRRSIAGLNFLMQVAGLALLAWSPFTASIYAGCALFGLGVGNVITLPGLLVEREFPRARFASIVSLITATNQLAFAFAPGLIGILRDATGDYGLALGLCAAADLIAAAVIVLGRPTQRALGERASPARPG
jgi:MFS family permease